MLERTHVRRPFPYWYFLKSTFFWSRCVQVFYGFGDEKLVKMIDEVKVPPADLRLNSEKVAPKAFGKVESH